MHFKGTRVRTENKRNYTVHMRVRERELPMRDESYNIQVQQKKGGI